MNHVSRSAAFAAFTVGDGTRVDRLYAFLVFLVGFGVLTQGGDAVGLPHGSEQAAWIALWGFGVVRYSRSRTRSFATVKRVVGLPLLAFNLLATMSSGWAPDGLKTISDALGLVATTFVGVTLAVSLGGSAIARQARNAASVVAVASLVAFLGGAPWARADDDSLVGLLAHRNSVGAVAGIALCLWLCGARQRGALSVAMPVLLGYILWLSDSRTSQAAVAVTLACVVCDRAIVANRRLGVAAALGFLVASIVAYHAMGGIGYALEGVGKNETLTGRTELWRLLLDLGQSHPIRGYGYSAVWAEGSATRAVIDTKFAGITSSHNILLEAFLALGVIGAALILASLARAALLLWQSPDVDAAVRRPTLVVIAYVTTRGVAESGFPVKNSSFLVLFVALVGALALARARDRRRAGQMDLERRLLAEL